MRSFDVRLALGFAAVLLAVSGVASPAQAQQQAQGFAVERLYPSAPGGGWFVMDDLSLRGGLGGDMQLTSGYAYKPLRVTDGITHLPVVQDEASTDFGFAATYDRWRLYLNLDVPLLIQGQGGVVGAYQLTAPSVDPGSHPDTLSDARLGVDGRLVGAPGSPFRLGAGAQLFVPEGSRADYDTDGTLRAMLRVLFAGDVGLLSYAGQLGVHIRPLDDAPTPGSPRGSELLFGAAAGARVRVGTGGTALVVGPEVYGQSAFRSFLGKDTTGLEGLLSARMEGTADDGAQLRVKLGAGGGLDQHFGAPEWRIVLAIELFDHGTDRDHDGVTDSKDACPDVAGIKTKDPKTNGCPAGTAP
jgi:OmpA-OmpF porin, OOP family